MNGGHTTFRLIHQMNGHRDLGFQSGPGGPSGLIPLACFPFSSGNFDPPAFQLIVSYYLLFVHDCPVSKRLQNLRLLR